MKLLQITLLACIIVTEMFEFAMGNDFDMQVFVHDGWYEIVTRRRLADDNAECQAVSECEICTASQRSKEEICKQTGRVQRYRCKPAGKRLFAPIKIRFAIVLTPP
jgi:hypothetical protein